MSPLVRMLVICGFFLHVLAKDKSYKHLMDAILVKLKQETADMNQISLPDNFPGIKYSDDSCIKSDINISNCTLYDLERIARKGWVSGTEDVQTLTLTTVIKMTPVLFECVIGFEYMDGKAEKKVKLQLIGYSNETSTFTMDITLVKRIGSVVVDQIHWTKFPSYFFLLKYLSKFGDLGRFLSKNLSSKMSGILDDLIIEYIRDAFYKIEVPLAADESTTEKPKKRHRKRNETAEGPSIGLEKKRERFRYTERSMKSDLIEAGSEKVLGDDNNDE